MRFFEPASSPRVKLCGFTTAEAAALALTGAGRAARARDEQHEGFLETPVVRSLRDRAAEHRLRRLGPLQLRERIRDLHANVEPLGLQGDQRLELRKISLGKMLQPTGTEGWRKAEVTAGGVDTRELSSQTLESRRIPDLHFIGEVVDVTGWLGGYNFQWAWSTGAAVGLANGDADRIVQSSGGSTQKSA